MSNKEIDLRKKGVLILDDNEVTRDSLKLIFEKMGATVYASGHLEKALTVLTGLMARNSAPVLIITDVKLPNTYGLEVLRKLDALSAKKVPLLLISRGLSQYAVRKASLYGVVGFARKPLLIEHLVKFAVEIICAFQPATQATTIETESKAA